MLRGLFAFVVCSGCIVTCLTACSDNHLLTDVNSVIQPQVSAQAQTLSEKVSETPILTPDADTNANDSETPVPSSADAGSTNSARTEPPEIDYATVRPYEVGQIMIIMYHGLVETEAEEEVYQRSIDNFKNDLQTFYDRGFRLITMKDWVENNINTEPGFTPLILTFDDGKSTAFSLENKDGELCPAADCAVDIMTKFYEEHPDFGNTAVFFINKNPFKGEGTLAERFKYLLDHGYEIGNHTMDHSQMSKLSAEEIQAEIGGLDKLIKDNAPGYEPYAISYPYGVRPKEELHDYVLDGVFEGSEYHYKIALREGQSVSPSAVNREGFDPINVPRVRGSDIQDTDLGWMLRQYESNPELRYISDGNPNRIAVPKKFVDNVDESSLGEKELFLYD